MSKFSEVLEELISERGLDGKSFAKEVGLSESCISDYKLKEALPNIATIIKFADFFNCSTDYLLGRESADNNLTFKECPPFCEQLKSLVKEFNLKDKDIYGSKNVDISKSRYFDWKSGRRLPSLDNVIKLAEIFDCRIDFLLGRES